MSRDGSGTYSRPVAPYVYDAVISETDMNTEMDQIATALTDSLTADGQKTASANQPMGGYRHTAVGAATAQTDYVRVDQVQKNTLNYLTSVGGTANAITATAAIGMTALTAGMVFEFIPGANTTSTTPTININTIGALTIKRDASANLVSGDIVSGRPARIFYNGTYAILLNPFTVSSAQSANIAISSLSGYGTAASKNLGADIVDDGLGNLMKITKTIIPGDVDYTILKSNAGSMHLSYGKSAGRTITLPSIATLELGTRYGIFNYTAETYPLTIAVSGSDMLDIGISTALYPDQIIWLYCRGGGVWSMESLYPSVASTSQKGLVSLATAAEINTGTNATKAVTAAAVAGSNRTVKAWWEMNSSGTLLGGFGVSSTVRNSTGNYTVNLAATAPSAYGLGLESDQLITSRVSKSTTSITYKTGFGASYNAADANSSGMIIY